MVRKILNYSTASAISFILILLVVGTSVCAQQRPYVNPTPKRRERGT